MDKSRGLPEDVLMAESQQEPQSLANARVYRAAEEASPWWAHVLMLLQQVRPGGMAQFYAPDHRSPDERARWARSPVPDAPRPGEVHRELMMQEGERQETFPGLQEAMARLPGPARVQILLEVQKTLRDWFAQQAPSAFGEQGQYYKEAMDADQQAEKLRGFRQSRSLPQR